MTKFFPVAMVPDSIEILYDLLKERESYMNISHQRMPTFDEHEAFVKSEPYAGWWIIEDGDIYRGAVYFTKQREIGIFIFREHRGKGYGTDALEFIKEQYGLPVLANIAPGNNESRSFFEKEGFALCQNTLRLA